MKLIKLWETTTLKKSSLKRLSIVPSDRNRTKSFLISLKEMARHF